MRAAEASRETAGLIEQTMNFVRQGSQLVTRTNSAFDELGPTVEKSMALIDEISAASSEQSQGIEQVNQASTEMDTVTQRTAANAEETASAAMQMHEQAARLRSISDELTLFVTGRQSAANDRPGTSDEAPSPAAQRKAIPWRGDDDDD